MPSLFLLTFSRKLSILSSKGFSGMNTVKKELLKNRYFRLARESALRSRHRTRFGAVLVFTKKKVHLSHNHHHKTHPMMVYGNYPDYCQVAHAELRCVCSFNTYRFGAIPTKAVLFIYREDAEGTLKDAKPCPHCMWIIRRAGIKRICYSTTTGYNTIKV